MGELGYGTAYRILDAQHFGVPQRRRRVFVVGYLGDWRRAAAVLFERHSLSGHPAPRRETREVSPTIPSRSTGCGGLGTDFDCDGGLIQWPAEIAPTIDAQYGDKMGYDNQHVNGGGDCLSPALANTLTRRMHKGINTTCDEGQTLIPMHGGGFDVAHSLRGEGFDASEDGTGRGTPLVPVAYQVSGNCGAWETGAVTGALDTGTDRTSSVVAFAIQERAVSESLNQGPQGKGYQADVAYTLEARNKVQSVATRAVRRLTPRECERLMGFPDDFTLVPNRNKPAADGPRYKALGNSMAVPVMAWIGERIQQVENMVYRP